MLTIVLLVLGCASGPAPTPRIIYVTPAPSVPQVSPTLSAVPAASPKPTPTQAPAARIELVPCDFGMKGGNGEPITYEDKDCQNQSYHITNPVEIGKVVTLTFTVKNVGTKASGPISAGMLGCTPLGRCTHTRYFLPDRFDLIGCKPSCSSKVTNDDTTWDLQWNVKLAPGKSADLIVTFRARYAAYNYIVAGLYGAPLSLFDRDVVAYQAALIRDWGDMQVVVVPR